MAINLKVEDDIQIVVFTGPLIKSEAQVLKTALDKKITNGRMKLLLDVTRLDINPQNIDEVLSIVENFESLKVSVAIAGLSAESWSQFTSKSGGRIHKFYTVEEGRSYLNRAASIYSSEDTNPAIKKLPSETIELLAEYEAKRHQKTYDPFRLMSLKENYKKDPSKAHIKQLENAVTECTKSRNDITNLVKELDHLSQEMLRLTRLRRSPVHYDEIAVHTKNLDKLIATAKKDIQEIKNQILTTTIISNNYNNQTKTLAQEWQKTIFELENKKSPTRK